MPAWELSLEIHASVETLRNTNRLEQYSPVYASDTEDENIHGDPVGTYLEAKRLEHEAQRDAEHAPVIGHPNPPNSDSEYEVVAEFYGPLYHSRLPVARPWTQSPVCHDTPGPG